MKSEKTVNAPLKLNPIAQRSKDCPLSERHVDGLILWNETRDWRQERFNKSTCGSVCKQGVAFVQLSTVSILPVLVVSKTVRIMFIYSLSKCLIRRGYYNFQDPNCLIYILPQVLF